MQEALEALEAYRKKDPGKNKVVVRFKAVGNAPIMKQNLYKITSTNRFQTVIQFLRKELGWKAGDPLFTYINLAFAPAPDDIVINLYKSFATEGHLIVNYSVGLIDTTIANPRENWVEREMHTALSLISTRYDERALRYIPGIGWLQRAA